MSPSAPAAAKAYALNLLASLLVMATWGTAVSCRLTFGEELGWRGYMLTRLVTAGAPGPVLMSVIWALWHVPMILSAQYAAGAHPGVSAAFFVTGVIAHPYLATWPRFRSGSIWPPVIMHVAWGAVIQGTFDRATAGTPASVGEFGRAAAAGRKCIDPGTFRLATASNLFGDSHAP